MNRCNEITGGGLSTATNQPSRPGSSGAAGGGEALRDCLKAELAAAEAAAKKKLESEWWDNSHLTVAAELEAVRSLRTRHRPPWEGPWSTYEWLNLDRAQLRRSIAIHEAGHMVLGRQVGMVVKEAAIADDLGAEPGQEPAGYVTWGPEDWVGPWEDFAMVAAAGEQAQMRWLKDEGLYTDRRGWAVEAHAWHDRHAVATQATTSASPISVSFGQPGTADVDWADLLHTAEHHLDQRWSQLLELADALDQHGHLKGADIDRITTQTAQRAGQAGKA